MKIRNSRPIRTALALIVSAMPLTSSAQPSIETATEARPITVRTEGVTSGEWTTDWKAAVEAASKSDAPILIYFSGSGWCSVCAFAEEEIFSRDAWRDYAKDKLVLVNADKPAAEMYGAPEARGPAAELRKRFEVSSYPQFVVLESDGRETLSQFGLQRDAGLFDFIASVGGALRRRGGTADKLFAGKAQQSRRQEYIALVKRLGEEKDKLDKWLAQRPPANESNKERFRAMMDAINGIESQIQTAEAERMVARLGESAEHKGSVVTDLGASEEYVTKLEELKTARQELRKWLCGKPLPTEANLARYQEMTQRLDQALAAVRALD